MDLYMQACTHTRPHADARVREHVRAHVLAHVPTCMSARMSARMPIDPDCAAADNEALADLYVDRWRQVAPLARP